MKKLLLVLVLVTLVTAFFMLDLHHYLTINILQASLSQFEARQADSPFLVITAFFVFYVLVATLSLPGAAVMTLAAGALFGLVQGSLIVSFASSIGATLAFLVSRYLLHDAIQSRFADRLKFTNEGLKKDGASYLFTLRMVPLFPFFVINLLMGLTPIRAVRFYGVSQVGMLAGTVVYVNAGMQFAQFSDPSDMILTSRVIYAGYQPNG